MFFFFFFIVFFFNDTATTEIYTLSLHDALPIFIIPELSLDRILQLSGIVFFVTLASGIYPAIKAARITPVQALKT